MEDGMPLQDIVNVQITRQTRAVTQASFGVALIVGSNGSFSQPLRYYGSLSSVLSDYAATTPEYLAAQAYFSQEPSPNRIAIGRRGLTAGNSLVEDLTELKNYDNSWYGLAITGRTVSDQLEAAKWVESEDKIFGCASADAIIISDPAETTSIVAQVKKLGLARTFSVYHDQAANQFPEMAIFGMILPKTAGSYTMAFKTLAGISVVNLSESQEKITLDKCANTYQSVGGVSITREGKVAVGEFLDVIIFVDWLKARMTESIYSKIVNLDKIPYTDSGIAIVEAEMQSTLQIGINNGGLKSFTIDVPKAASIPATDKANRFLPDMKFAGILAGAIHSVVVNGVVTL
jgi:hypothetical protein